MFRCAPKSWLSKFRTEERGSITIEAVITLPLLIWAVGATYEFFELHRYNSARDKASYTIADMISRENDDITPIYLDNAKIVFDTIANDRGANALRVSVIRFDSAEEDYIVKWSQVRGTAALEPLESEDLELAHDILPILRGGQELIVVESESTYPAIFKVGLSDDLTIRTIVKTNPRFVPQVNWNDGTGTSSSGNTAGTTEEG
jgi:hypothetical protein